MRNKEKSLRAVIYLRVSSEEQVKGYGLTVQQELCQKLVNAKGWRLKKVYSDEGRSGRKDVEKREDFMRMRNDGLAREFDVIVIYDNLRFGRNDNVDVPCLLQLTDAGVRVVSHDLRFDTHLPNGKPKVGYEKLSIFVPMLGATEDGNKIVERCVAGQKQKLRRGDPRAFNGKPIARVWDDENKIFKLIPENAEEWRWVVRSYLSGNATTTISKEITKRGDKITHSPSRLLEHLKKNLGDKWTVTYKDGEEFTFACERIVDEETEKRVKRRIAERKHAPHRKPYKYLLSGKIFCANCHKQLQTKPSYHPDYSSNKRYYYFHPKADRTGNDCVRNVRVEYIDRA